jgi:hypothetical protein
MKVGSFRADILCEAEGSDCRVLIENQLGGSDHGHLGQLLTYASGLDAATIVWVAPAFRDEHRAALNWLNRITDGKVRFFAVQVELWSISGGLPAPKFRLVEGPRPSKGMANKMAREIADKPSDSAKRRLKYWQDFLSRLRLDDPDIRVPSPNSLGNLRFSLQGNDLWITVYAAASLGRIGVFLRGNPEYYARLQEKRRAIELQLGEACAWDRGDDGWDVAVRQRADPEKKNEWPAQHNWLATRLNDFIRVFKPYVEGAK